MRIPLTLAVALALAPAARAEEGRLDWERKVVRCKGSGAPNVEDAGGNPAVARVGAEKAAQLDAFRNCLAVLRGVQIESGKTAGSVLDSDAALSGSVSGLVRGFRAVGKPRYDSDGGVEIDVEVPLDGALSDALLPREPGAPIAPEDAVQVAGGPSALVIDARGLKLVRALAPRVKDEKGRVVYGPATLNRTGRKLGGAAAYALDLDVARRAFADRLGPRPWMVKAVRAEGADLVLSQTDADQLQGTPPRFLAQGKVVILAD